MRSSLNIFSITKIQSTKKNILTITSMAPKTFEFSDTEVMWFIYWLGKPIITNPLYTHDVSLEYFLNYEDTIAKKTDPNKYFYS